MAKSGSDHRKVIEMMKEATGASDDEVCLMLQLHDGDPNKATEALLSSACGGQADRAMSAARVPCLLRLCCCAAPCQRPLLTILVGSFRRSLPGGGEQEGQAGKGAAAMASWAQSVVSQPRLLSQRPSQHNVVSCTQVEEQRKKEADQQRRSGVADRRAAPGFPGRGGRGGRFEGRGGRGKALFVRCDARRAPCCLVRANMQQA